MIGSVLNDRYHLDAELARDGKCLVYEAFDGLLDRNEILEMSSHPYLVD